MSKAEPTGEALEKQLADLRTAHAKGPAVS
jgi:hypothetical protein